MSKEIREIDIVKAKVAWDGGTKKSQCVIQFNDNELLVGDVELDVKGWGEYHASVSAITEPKSEYKLHEYYTDKLKEIMHAVAKHKDGSESKEVDGLFDSFSEHLAEYKKAISSSHRSIAIDWSCKSTGCFVDRTRGAVKVKATVTVITLPNLAEKFKKILAKVDALMLPEYKTLEPLKTLMFQR